MSLSRLPLVMGHRGAAGHAPENTLGSIRTAARSGADWVEFDVMLTGDRVPVLFHDDKLKRTTGQAGLLAETSFAAVAQLDAGAWFGDAFAGETVPSLETAVRLVGDLRLRANIEIKPSEGRDLETAEAVMETLSQVWPKGSEPPLISSFNPVCLRVAKEVQPDWPRGYISFEMADNWIDVAAGEGCVSFHVYHKRMTEARVRTIKDAAYLLACFTVNEPVDAVRLRDWGVDCMISDCPGEILDALT